MMNTECYRADIVLENPEAAEADMAQVNAAAKLSFWDDGWEYLKDQCVTQAARLAIDGIERYKYRLDECRHDCE